MTSETVRLQRREEVAHGTMAFHFDKPAGFSFKPGQAIDLILPDPAIAGTEGARHAFSIVSAPHEGELVVATRRRDSAFKNALAGLALGAPAQVEGPFGALTLHNKAERAAVFVAGGIGITPFMSMLRHAAHQRLQRRLVLVYSNRRPEDSAFLSELQRLEGDYPNFSLVATMTRMAESRLPWMGETGLVDAALLKRVAAELPDPVYYVAGPPAMVAGLRETLERVGVDDDDIRSEEFYGY
ncbi:ferredoxin--NADP reductase [Ramlibacter alkalitolerans]|uniref:FAD-dependent oxidoreductase n=1 Tax=Ramlibacter alkalitolerans TaxID=2039631 RepID=A0ABS1JKN1_9BURK|nr:FAD-dependent oxidoreductase [Ramlibacter alkalitolerans]MBL0424764.1 FAD-dependent oxidoreductase [Ramlibacter alkalitolerans]